MSNFDRVFSLALQPEPWNGNKVAAIATPILKHQIPSFEKTFFIPRLLASSLTPFGSVNKYNHPQFLLLKPMPHLRALTVGISPLHNGMVFGVTKGATVIVDFYMGATLSTILYPGAHENGDQKNFQGFWLLFKRHRKRFKVDIEPFSGLSSKIAKK